jgi:hypothetical protein
MPISGVRTSGLVEPDWPGHQAVNLPDALK